MKNIYSLLLVFILSWSGLVMSQINQRPEGKSCSTLEGRLEFIQKFTGSYYDWLLKKVERVPPDTEKYLSQEYKDSVSTNNQSRFSKVVSNEYYYPWRLRDGIEKLNEESKTGYQRVSGWGVSKKSPQESEMIYYINLLDRNSDVYDRYGEYSDFDGKRKQSYLSQKDDGYRIGFSKGIYSTVIQDLISCSFKK